LNNSLSEKLTIDDIIEIWRNFIVDAYPSRDDEKHEEYTYRRKLDLDFGTDHHVRYDIQFPDILDFNEVLADALLEVPSLCLKGLSIAIQLELEGQIQERKKRGLQECRITTNLKGLGDERLVRLEDLRDYHINRLITVVVNIIATGPPETPYATKFFYCGSADNHHNRISVGLLDQTKEPGICKDRQCNSTHFELVEDHCTHLSTQMIQLQQHDNDILAQTPEPTDAFLTDALVGLTPDTNKSVTLHCILRDKLLGTKSNARHYNYLEVVGIEETAKESFVVTEQHRKWARELVKVGQPDIIELIVNSICPSVHGLKGIKLALALQAAGGANVVVGGARLRGLLHILLFGDPSVAKSDLMECMARVTPNSHFLTATGASGPGLTFAMNENKITGKWTVQPGLLSRSNNGTAVVDELLLLSKDDLDKTREALERGVISVGKAGVFVTLPAHTSLLAGGNRERGRIDPNKPASEQLKLHPALISRLDLIFVIIDQPNVERDRAILKAVLRRKRQQLPEDMEKWILLNEEQLRIYFAVCREIEVKFPEELDEDIEKIYLPARKIDNQGIRITPRQILTITKLAEAVARLRLRNIVVREDVKVAERLFNLSQETQARVLCGIHPDIDSYIGAPSPDDEIDIRLFQNIIHHMGGVVRTEGIDRIELTREISLACQNEERARKILSKMEKLGKILLEGGRYRFN